MSVPDKPEFLYFNVPGRVAGIRVLLHAVYGRDGWVDRRVGFAEWGELKKEMPLRYLPILKLPGLHPGQNVVVHHAEAITRWAAQQAGLYPYTATHTDTALLLV